MALAIASAATLCWTPASALSAEVPTIEPSLVGQAVAFGMVAKEAVGAAQYRWSFGDDTVTAFSSTGARASHTYAAPGHYNVIATVKDERGGTSVSFQHTVHYPLTAKRPTASTDIVYDQSRNRVYSVNEDNDSISAVDTKTLKKVAELAVYHRPVSIAIAPNGKLWVVHRDDYAVAIVDLDKMVVERGFRLPDVSQPINLVMSPTGDAAYIPLMATGKLLKLDPTTGQTIAQVDLGPTPRGVSVSADGKNIYVTRFISPDAQGQVWHVDAATFKVAERLNIAPDTTTPDSDQNGRGLPNYLFTASLSPDGRRMWVASKKDNIYRGILRDKIAIGQDNTVRPQVGVLDMLMGGPDQIPLRIDLDDRNLPSHVEFSPLGDYAFVSCTGSDLVQVHDAYSLGFITSLSDAGIGPRGTVLTPDNRLFVNGTLGRNVVVYDVGDLLVDGSNSTKQIVKIPTVAQEKLPPDVLLGKRVFVNSADSRMTFQGYLSCATCHFEGFEDGRVWDFTSQSEGLRNTPSMLGRRGTAEGRLLWSGALDEIQDFEHQIRTLFAGRGFIADSALAQGTRNDPLGQPVAGLSKELDAMAAYVKTLDHVNPSPFRNPDGTMTAQGQAGEAVFLRLGCDFCHTGKDMTDSSRGLLHDVGTLKPSSGTRAGQPLLGIDTPTLLGVWETAPYLHDGSAATLRDVLVTTNPTDEHGFVGSLGQQEVDQLVAYMLQLDNALARSRLPFEPEPETAPDAGSGGNHNADGGTGSDQMVTGSDPAARGGLKCAMSGSLRDTGGAGLWALLPVIGWMSRRRRTRLATTSCAGGATK